MKLPLFIVCASSIIVSFGNATIAIENKNGAVENDDHPWTLASPKELLRQALADHIRGLSLSLSPPSVSTSTNLRLGHLGHQRLLEDNNNNNDGEDNNDEEENNNEGAEENNNEEQQQGQEDEQVDEEVEDEEDPQAASSCAICDQFNNMSHTAKIWTLVLVCWGFLLLLAICILLVRACTARKRYPTNKKQPLISSSLALDDPNKASRGRTKTRRGWFGRVVSRSRSRSRSRVRM